MIQAVGILFEANFRFYEAILLLDDYAHTCADERDQIERTISRFEGLANQSPENFTCAVLFLRAERARAMGDKQTAQRLYDEGIEDANVKRYLHRSAIMNERCATMMDRPKWAAGYIFEAERIWRSWGCTIRADALLKEDPI